MKNCFFITGTDTDVGKTVVSRGLIRALVNRGNSVIALKPVESGVPYPNGFPEPLDGRALTAAAKSNDSIEDVCCYMFPDPVSPHLAAKRYGVHIHEQVILNHLKKRALDSHVVIAEGAGGLLVPLSPGLVYGDLIAKSGWGLVIVAPNKLGTINNTLLTIEAARSRNIPVIGVILNGTPESQWENAAAISEYGAVTILGEFPTVAKLEDDELGKISESVLDLDLIERGGHVR